MDATQVGRLLALIVLYDGRIDSADPGVRQVWGQAARRASWTPREAEDAVHAHYAESTWQIMPGHVTQLIRSARVKGTNLPPWCGRCGDDAPVGAAVSNARWRTLPGGQLCSCHPEGSA